MEMNSHFLGQIELNTWTWSQSAKQAYLLGRQEHVKQTEVNGSQQFHASSNRSQRVANQNILPCNDAFINLKNVQLLDR